MIAPADLALATGVAAVVVWSVLLIAEASFGRRRLSMGIAGFLASVGLLATATGFWAQANGIVLPFAGVLTYIASIGRGALVWGGVLRLAEIVDDWLARRAHQSFQRARLTRVMGTRAVNHSPTSARRAA